MKRSLVSFWLDVATAINGVALLYTGLLLAFVLPHGQRGGGGNLALWGLRRHDWGDVHLVLALVMTALLLVHVALHWSWIVCMVGRLVPGARPSNSVVARAAWLGLSVVFIGALAGSLWLAPDSVQRLARVGAHAPRRMDALTANQGVGSRDPGQHHGVRRRLRRGWQD
jgi:hypothetical protein